MSVLQKSSNSKKVHLLIIFFFFLIPGSYLIGSCFKVHPRCYKRKRMRCNGCTKGQKLCIHYLITHIQKCSRRYVPQTQSLLLPPYMKYQCILFVRRSSLEQHCGWENAPRYADHRFCSSMTHASSKWLNYSDAVNSTHADTGRGEDFNCSFSNDWVNECKSHGNAELTFMCIHTNCKSKQAS